MSESSDAEFERGNYRYAAYLLNICNGPIYVVEPSEVKIK